MRIALVGRHGLAAFAAAAAVAARAGVRTTEHAIKFFTVADGLESPPPDGVLGLSDHPNTPALHAWCLAHGVEGLVLPADSSPELGEDCMSALLLSLSRGALEPGLVPVRAATEAEEAAEAASFTLEVAVGRAVAERELAADVAENAPSRAEGDEEGASQPSAPLPAAPPAASAPVPPAPASPTPPRASKGKRSHHKKG